MSSQMPTSMSAEERANRAAEELASRVAQRSTLSSNAAPFVPSFLQNPAQRTTNTTNTNTTTNKTGKDGSELQMKSAEENMIMMMQHESFADELQELYDHAETHTQLPSASSVAATMAVAATALKTFGDMTEEELQLLEEYLWDPTQEGEEFMEDEEGDDEDRLFVNQDDGMRPDEEEWLIEQMIETDAVASRKKKQEAQQKVVNSEQNVPLNS